MEDTEIPGSYRWVFLGGPNEGEIRINQSGAPGTVDIDGQIGYVYQLQTNPEYPVDDDATAKDVTVSVYAWVPANPIVDDPGDPIV